MKTIELLQKMMAFQPVTADVACVNQLVDFLATYLRGKGLHVKLEKMKGRKVLFAATRRGKAPELLLNSHLDVLPAPEAMFKLRRRGAYLYGRGTNDCLGNTAVIAQALAAVGARANVGAIFSTDEETGGSTTAHMVQRGYLARQLVLIMDGGGDAVAVAQKGICAVRLVAEGKACHSSRPWLGNNAIDILIDGYTKIKRAFPNTRAGDEWHDTFSANIVKAGSVFNRVPDTAEMILDIRHTERTLPAELLKKIRKLSGLQCEIFNSSPVVFSDTRVAALRQLREFMQKYLNREIPFTRLNGASDARHFQQLKVPIAIIGVPGDGAHGADEHVQAKALSEYEGMLKDYMLSL